MIKAGCNVLAGFPATREVLRDEITVMEMHMRNLRKLRDLADSGAFRSEVMVVFFEAMNAGYAATEKPEKSTVVELPGSKTISYVRGPWKVVDIYFVTPLSTASCGMTIISYEEIPVWMMQYHGQYEEEAVPCLKAALRAAYVQKDFIGGRGPNEFVYNGYSYRNRPGYAGLKDFEFFSGTEEVYTLDGNSRKGWHSYYGAKMY